MPAAPQMALWLLVLTSLMAVVTCQFTPGCSFVNGQCMYQVQLGHQGQCDGKRAASDTQCCAELDTKMTGLTSDVDELKSQVSTLMSELLSTKTNLSATVDTLTEAERRTQQLLDTLALRETELNQTQHELARVLNNAGDEIQTLRAKVTELTSDLNTCRGTLGLATNTTVLPVSSILGSDVHVDYCHFEDANDTVCGYTMDSGSVRWTRGQGQMAQSTGPWEDHTYGVPAGHYMFLDARDAAVHGGTTSGHVTTVTMTSRQYPAAMRGYCVRFWYNMYGPDIKTLEVFAKIAGAGSGYPVFSVTGTQGQDWHMGQVELDSEYTARPFHLQFQTSTDAYHSSFSSSSLYSTLADVAIDDVYVYNTSCKNIPLCAPGGVTRNESGVTYCYTFHVQPDTWYEAALTCRGQGANSHLVSVTSQDEQDFLVAAIKADQALTTAGWYGFYTSGADQRSEQTFDWTDTGTPYRTTYSNWKAGQPNDVGGQQDCLLMQYPELDFQWGDVECTSQHPFICETSYPTPHTSVSASPLVG